jgi:hypothetical protein
MDFPVGQNGTFVEIASFVLLPSEDLSPTEILTCRTIPVKAECMVPSGTFNQSWRTFDQSGQFARSFDAVRGGFVGSDSFPVSMESGVFCSSERFIQSIYRADGDLSGHSGSLTDWFRPSTGLSSCEAAVAESRILPSRAFDSLSIGVSGGMTEISRWSDCAMRSEGLESSRCVLSLGVAIKESVEIGCSIFDQGGMISADLFARSDLVLSGGLVSAGDCFSKPNQRGDFVDDSRFESSSIFLPSSTNTLSPIRGVGSPCLRASGNAISNEITETNIFDSSKQFSESKNAMVSDDLKSSGAGHDLMNSIKIVISSEMIETDCFDSSQLHGRSTRAVATDVGSSRAGHPPLFSSSYPSRTHRFDQSAPCRSMAGMNETSGFGLSDQFDASLDQAKVSTVVWMGVAGSLIAIVLGVVGLTFLFGCRRLSFLSEMSLPESEIEGEFTDSHFSLAIADPFLSEQNALTAGDLIE